MRYPYAWFLLLIPLLETPSVNSSDDLNTEHRSSTFAINNKATLATLESFEMKLATTTVTTAATAALLVSMVSAGPIGYGICQAGCSAVVMACYSAAGFTWGAVLGATAPATIVVCNTASGTCHAACAAVLLGPTP
ncbi:hypothetical protein HBI25_188780 [Parastagonospora nodorum]|nr:hypothetical protein HBH53_241860 [Parastagonospora nodorum]KAH3964471.1 hypothetical protein HBH51_159210 [Parastagonospora nodorum]KAH4002806.1 hypothetical protein HBI10_066580 [Parastagonospora nodorum]KAH4132951.1 hypothetical protein HBH47_002910 [Parastagonospora nodorum]KAH4159916.1 hypothetical protein HBH43_186090 [Parastagonospora nodorum]